MWYTLRWLVPGGKGLTWVLKYEASTRLAIAHLGRWIFHGTFLCMTVPSVPSSIYFASFCKWHHTNQRNTAGTWTDKLCTHLRKDVTEPQGVRHAQGSTTADAGLELGGLTSSLDADNHLSTNDFINGTMIFPLVWRLVRKKSLWRAVLLRMVQNPLPMNQIQKS